MAIYYGDANGKAQEVVVVGMQGPAGPQGPQGATGPQGPAGQGVPTGGTAGQVLTKVDGTNYNTRWGDPSFSPRLWFDSIDQTAWRTYIDLDTDVTLIRSYAIEFVFKSLTPNYCEMTFNTHCTLEIAGGSSSTIYPNAYPDVSAIVDHFKTAIEANYPGKTIQKNTATMMKNRGYVSNTASTSFLHYQQDELSSYAISEVDGLNNANIKWGDQKPTDLGGIAFEVGGEVTVYIPLA